MKGKKLTEWLANKKVVSSCAAIALAAVIGGVSLFSGAGETAEDYCEDYLQYQDNQEDC